MRFDFLYNFCLRHFLILRRTERDMVTKLLRCSCEVPYIRIIFHSHLNIFFKKSQKIIKYQVSRKFVHWLPNRFCADERTDMMTLIASPLFLQLCQLAQKKKKIIELSRNAESRARCLCACLEMTTKILK